MAYSKKLQKALNENPFLMAQIRAFNIVLIPNKLKPLFGDIYKFAKEVKKNEK